MKHYMQGNDLINIWLLIRIYGGQREWNNTFKVLTEKEMSTKILYKEKISFKNESRYEDIFGWKKSKNLHYKEYALQKMQREVLQAEEKW